MEDKLIINKDLLENKIYTIRGVQVMFDRDLAKLYGVETRRLNEQVKRNIDRFPSKFMIQLTKDELKDWMSQFATSNKEIIGLRKMPYAFTEQGVSMLGAVLKSDISIKSFTESHDRFMIIDKTNIYHIGASLKDLGKKWFAFSKLEISSFKILDKLK